MRINFSKIFQPATSFDNRWNLIKTTLQSVWFWLIFLYVIPQFITQLEAILSIPSFTANEIIGWFLLGSFSLLNIYCGYTMSWYGKGTPLPLDCPQQLVIRGPYRIVRNPMAVAGIGQGISVGIILGSFSVIVYAALGAIIWNIFVRPTEEADLEQRFGVTYLQYKQVVKCWIPTFSLI